MRKENDVRLQQVKMEEEAERQENVRLMQVLSITKIYFESRVIPSTLKQYQTNKETSRHIHTTT